MQDAQRLLFEQIYQAHRQVMFYVANRILRDPQRAEDAVHDAFLRFFDQAPAIDLANEKIVRSYLVVVTQNLAIDILKKDQKIMFIEEDKIEKTGPQKDDFDHFEDTDQVERLLKAIPEAYAGVLKLKYLNQMTYEEIAQALDLKQATVRKRVQRGLDMVRNIQKDQSLKKGGGL